MSKNSISYYIFSILIFLTAFQFSAWGLSNEIYSVLRNVIIATIVILFLLNAYNSSVYLRNISSFRIHLFGTIIFALILFLLRDLKVDFAPLRDLALALIVLVIGLTMNLTEKQYLRLIKIYIFLYTIAALSIVYTYGSGFEIQERYLPIPKNQLAPAFGVAFILSLYFGFKKKGIDKWVNYIWISLLFASLLVIRGRAVILAVIITIFIFIFYYIRKSKLFFIILLLLTPLIWQYLYDALFLNYDITNLDSISTGRMERNIVGLDFFLNHPFGGQMTNPNFKGATIHNYLLFNIVNYGIFISLILFAIYFKYISITIKSFKNNSFLYFEVAPLVMTILLVISFFEYTYPFAPGSAIFFPFFLMGQYLKEKRLLIPNNQIFESKHKL